MFLDPDQREAVRSGVSLAVQAGPGSGKTRTLVAKALREAANLRGTSLHVACITMSRAATSVIEERIRSFVSQEDEARIFVGTIHAFCLQEIFQPFHRFVDAYRDGWQLLASDQEAYRDYANGIFGERAEKVLKHLPYVRRSAYGEPENLGGIGVKEMMEFWAAIEQGQFVDFPSLLYRSIQVLREQDEVAEFIGARYRWILVDEFQDTTNMQLAILSELNRGSTSYFVVGDRNQAIYSFAGASRKAQDAFIKQIGITDLVTLSRNYRSTSRICDVANVIIDTNMRSARDIPGPMPTVRHVKSKKYSDLAMAIRDHFVALLDSSGRPRCKAAIIAPNSFVSNDLAAELFKIGIESARSDAALEHEPLLRLLRGLSEYWAGQSLTGAQYTIDILGEMLSRGQPSNWSVDEFGVSVLAFTLLNSFADILSSKPTWPSVVTSVAETLVGVAYDLGLVSRYWCEPILQARRIADDMAHRNEPFDALAVRLYSEAMLITWIFRSKGLEFDAVAIVEVEDGAIPHYRSYESNNLGEERRKFFVAITRASDILQMYSDRQNRSPYLDELLKAKAIEGVGGPKRSD